ncbi:hypothetical protein DQW50_16250 [Halorubrum sp. 48-1-W]|uniref:hypothetical protein n=1 Tax=Halorubrum sp. 48-1-W TaxID=2249761 RepID=UPI000DCC73F7|nr:hypothetical protein [Halorubrum sp. 48-1-W]RAW44074.1 hypothetical protein DQW50_16250 [Halorubrum sp. 48-1-W]
MNALRCDPISEPSGYIGRGAVLYDTRDADNRRCCGKKRDRHLAHVTGVYRETTTGTARFEVWDGTHTVREWVHGDDLLAMFEPAGFTIDTGRKPTYVLTREHGVRDDHDLMTRGERR